jgi:predicted P-loop ATPase
MTGKDTQKNNTAVDEKSAVKEKTDSDGKKAPRNRVMEGLKYLDSHYDFRFNSISLAFEMKLKDNTEFTKLNEDSLFIELQDNFIPIALSTIISILKSGVICEPYDPFKVYFQRLSSWNESKDPDYIEKLASYIKTDDDISFRHHLKKHLVRTVRCALNDNYINKQAFILVGSTQNTGKTTFIRYLCPSELVRYRAENINTDKDSRVLLCKNFIINLDELDSLDRKDLSALKSLFSKDWINDRLPYDKVNSQIPRRASFFGSTNLDEFLTDETGTVRWLCFRLQEVDRPIDFGYKSVDIDDVWRQAYALYNQGFPSDLTLEEIRKNEERNADFKTLTVEREAIEKLFQIDSLRNVSNFRTATEITKMILDSMQGIKLNITRERVGKALKELKYVRTKLDGKRGYYIAQIQNVLAPTCPGPESFAGS